MLCHSGKENVVADTLSRLSVYNGSHVEDDKNELVWDVYRLSQLSIQLVDSSKGGVMVQNHLLWKMCMPRKVSFQL